MGRRQEVVDAQVAEQARVALREQKEARIGQRLQAIASCGTHPLGTVAEIFGVSARTVWQWARRFKAQGVDGLRDQPRGHRKGRLDAEQQGEFVRWLEQGRNADGDPAHWTLAKLQSELERVFKIHMSVQAVWKRVRKLGFRQKVPRPRHRGADPEAAEAFKKNR